MQMTNNYTINQHKYWQSKHVIWTWQAWPSWQQCPLIFQPIELSLFQYIENNEYLMNVHTDTNIIPRRWYSQMENVETILSNVYDEFNAQIQWLFISQMKLLSIHQKNIIFISNICFYVYFDIRLLFTLTQIPPTVDI